MKKSVTIIIVSFKSEKIIADSIKSFGKNHKIIVIENSGNKLMKINLEKKFKNVQVVLNKNNGFGQAANLGVKKSKTEYVMFCSPDISFKKDPIKEFLQYSKKLNNKLGALIPADKEIKFQKIKKIEKPIAAPVIFISKKNFKKIKGFDERIFLYFEDIDIINRMIKNKLSVYQLPLFFKHKYGSHNKLYSFEVEINRNWHYMWSKFYFIKKNSNFSKALMNTFPTFVRSLIKLCFFYIFNRNKFLIYKARFLGLTNSYLNNKSWYRPKVNK